jgi:hypothetical protein
MTSLVKLFDHVTVPSFMMVSSGIQVILKLLPQQFAMLQCWCCWWKEFMKYAIEMASCGMVCISSFLDNQVRHTSYTEVITSTVSEAIVLVLCRGGIYEVCCSDGLSMIEIPSFMTVISGIQVILRLLPEQFERLHC